MEKRVKRFDGYAIEDTVIQDFLLSKGLNPSEFRLANVYMFEEDAENGDYIHTGEAHHVIPAKYTDTAFIMHYDFHHRNLELTSEHEGDLATSVGVQHAHEEGVVPTLFTTEDLYRHLGLELPDHPHCQ